MKFIFIFCILCVSESAFACSMKISPSFRDTAHRSIDHTIYGSKIIFFSVPKIKVENIKLHGRSDGSGKPGSINCPNYLEAELSLPEDSPYSFAELGVYFRLNKENFQKISIEQIPFDPLKLNTPKSATYLITFKMNSNLAVSQRGLSAIDIEVIAIDSSGEMGESTFVKAKWY